MNRWQLQQAVRTLRGGGIIAYPTEAVYGLGCNPFDGQAVTRLLALKQRPLEKGLILIAANLDQLTPFMTALDEADIARLQASWPGPNTWLVPTRPETPTWLRGRHHTIALRITAHPIAAALCRAAGHALVSTSANPASRPPARTPLQVRRYFEDQLDAIVHGPLGAESRPTAIRDLASGRLQRA